MGYRKTLFPHEDSQAVEQQPREVSVVCIYRYLNPSYPNSSSQMDKERLEMTGL